MLPMPRFAAVAAPQASLVTLCLAVAAAAAGAALPAAAAQLPSAAALTLPCRVVVGERAYDLSELGTHLRHLSEEPDSRGWAYSLSACGDVPPRSVGAGCHAALPAAVLQETNGACYSLGASSTRTVAALARGVALSFDGGSRCGETPRSSVVTVECADVPTPDVVRWSHGATQCSYAGVVRARAGCAVGCARDAAGAVCSGVANGVCVAEEGGEGPARCKCAEGRSGAACTDKAKALPADSGTAKASGESGVAGPARGGVLCAVFILAAFLVAALAAAQQRASKRCSWATSTPGQPPVATAALRVLPLLFIAAAFHAAGESISPATSAGMLRVQKAAECAALKSAAIVIVSYQPSTRPPLPVFERGLRNVAQFWPFPSNDVDVFIADNSDGDPGSAALLRNASRRAFGDSAALKIVQNKGLHEGYRYVYGGLRAVIRKERWHACFPYHYLVAYSSATALLKKLQFEPPTAGGQFRNDFLPFMNFSNAGYEWGSSSGQWIARQVEAAGVSFNESGRSVFGATGVFADSFVMSRTCLEAWLKRRIFLDSPRVETKNHDMSTEALSGILASVLCGWTGASFDGPLVLYMADCRGAGEGCVNMSDAALEGRTIMKVWGTA